MKATIPRELATAVSMLMSLVPAASASNNCPWNFPETFPDGSIVVKIGGKWSEIQKKRDAVADQAGNTNLIYVVKRPEAEEGAIVVKIVSAVSDSPGKGDKGAKISVETDPWNSKCQNASSGRYSANLLQSDWVAFHADLTPDKVAKQSEHKEILAFHRNYLPKKKGNLATDCRWTASVKYGNRKQFLLPGRSESVFWQKVAEAANWGVSAAEAANVTRLVAKVRMTPYKTDDDGRACVRISLSRADWANSVTVNDLEKKRRRGPFFLLRHRGDTELRD